MPKLHIKLDLEKDAWNWWDACNKISHGVDWKENIDPNLQKHIVGKNQIEAYGFLLPYLEKLYQDMEIDKYIQEIQSGFDKINDKLFDKMAKITGHPVYRENFTCFITSFPRFAYDYPNGYIWISCKKGLDFQILTVIHEILHFQYFQYFGERVWDEIGKEKHAVLKEAMTVIINEEFQDITSEKETGYDLYKKLGNQLLNIWKNTKNMDQFIDQAILLMKQSKTV